VLHFPADARAKALGGSEDGITGIAWQAKIKLWIGCYYGLGKGQLLEMKG